MPQRRILVIDDEPAIAALIRRAAEQCGYRATVALDLAAVDLALDGAPPTVICLDILMPGTDGVEVLRLLADRGLTSKLLLVSGFDSGVVESVLRLGQALGLDMAGVVPKPIELAKFRNLLLQFDDQVLAA